jgi:hypothetical protein
MNPLNWNDELCGKVITPESWIGGVVEMIRDNDGETCPPRWDIIEICNLVKDHPCENWDYFYSEKREFPVEWTRPVMPPRGWAGLSDAELWDAVFGAGSSEYIEINGDVSYWPADELFNVDSHQVNVNGLLALQLAIGNALVLHQRLSEVQK